jgi:predicted RNase H-like HicB family nuclease
MTDANRYPASVHWSDEDGGFIAIAPDLPGCSAFGKTQDEALAELQDAIDAWMQAARAAGNPIPAPSRLPDDDQYSGKLLLRIPRSLHAKLATAAKQEGTSLNQYLLHLLSTANARADSISGVRVYVVTPFALGEPARTMSTGTALIDPSKGRVAQRVSAKTHTTH